MKFNGAAKKTVSLRTVLLAVLLLGSHPGIAVQIGQTQEEIIARYGPPPLADHQKEIAIYRWDLWKLEIHFVDETARKLIYTKTDRLSYADEASILTENGGMSAWRQFTDRIWLRSDGATATLDGTTSRTLILQGNHRFTQPTPSPSPAPAAIRASTPASISTPAPTLLLGLGKHPLGNLRH